MDNRFKQSVESQGEFEETRGDFVKSSVDLAKEIAEKGVRGAELTATEKAFMKHTALFMIQGLVKSGR